MPRRIGMRTNDEVWQEITRVMARDRHVLDRGPATLAINAPVAMMQVSAKATLDVLYWVVGQRRPRFACDDATKQDHD